MTPLLRFDRVTLARGGRVLFSGIDFRLGPGDALQVTGPNGCGKSSLIRLAAGLLRAEAGTVERSCLALADYALALDRELPLRRALAFWTSDTAIDGLAALGLVALADVPVRLLSTGQARRAALARVVGSAAPLWLLDEPFNGLDPSAAEILRRLISAHRAAGGAVLAASHLPLPGDWSHLELGR